MPLTIVHTIASWFLRRRIDQIEEFVKRPHQVQENVCAKLLETAQGNMILHLSVTMRISPLACPLASMKI